MNIVVKQIAPWCCRTKPRTEPEACRSDKACAMLPSTIARNRAVTWDIRASRGAIYSLPPQILPLRR
jgi:hypothetical protein